MVGSDYYSIRIFVFYALFVVLSIAIIAKIINIQQVDTEDMEQLKKRLQENEVVLSHQRGNICADDGSILATSVMKYYLRYDLRAPIVRRNYVKYSEQFCTEVASFFGISKDKLRKRLDKAYRDSARWFLIYPELVDYNTLEKFYELESMSSSRLGKGLVLERECVRLLPHGDMGGRTIGTLNKGRYGGWLGSVGNSGMESAFEKYLRGEDGLAIKTRLPGSWVDKPVKESVDGRDVISTINVSLQDFTANALNEQMRKTQSTWGTAIVMEVATGDVKAIANIGRKKDGTYGEVYNYAIGHHGAAEPGSTFKLMSLMAALEDGLVDTTDVYDVGNGLWVYNGQNIRDSNYGRGGYGKINVKDIFVYSSNVGTAKVITDKYKGKEKDFIDRLYHFGLNKPLDIGFEGEGMPSIKYPDGSANWWASSIAQIAYGYEVKLTPLQTLTFYNAVANGGKMMKPRFVSEIRENGSLYRTLEPEVIKPLVCSKSTINKAKNMLREACVRGTGKAIQEGLPIAIAGKTGTAQVAYESGGYVNAKGEKRYLASFAGYFPADNPKYSMIVAIFEPKNEFYGGVVAGPVFKSIAAKVYSTLMTPIEAQNENANEDVLLVQNAFVEDVVELANELKLADIDKDDFNTHRLRMQMENNKVKIDSCVEYSNSVPNVVGMIASDAMFLLESSGFRVRVSGFGKVKSQSVKAGEKLKQGEVIKITLG